MIWILIYMTVWHGGYSAATSRIEFGNQSACIWARDAMKSDLAKAQDLVFQWEICVPKS